MRLDRGVLMVQPALYGLVERGYATFFREQRVGGLSRSCSPLAFISRVHVNGVMIGKSSAEARNAIRLLLPLGSVTCARPDPYVKP